MGAMYVWKRDGRFANRPYEEEERRVSAYTRTMGKCTPILTFPPDEGRERGRWEGERVALRLGRLLNTMALNIPTFRSFEVIRRWLL